MSILLFTIVGVSLIGITAILLSHARENLRGSLFLLVMIIIFGVIPLVMLPLPVGAARGEGNSEIWFLVALYIALLLGMLSQHAYARFSQPRRRRHKFDLGLFLAPVFASPIILIPLFAVVQATGVDLYQAHAARAMLFLVAFENGFFWKIIFDQRRHINLENHQDEK